MIDACCDVLEGLEYLEASSIAFQAYGFKIAGGRTTRGGISWVANGVPVYFAGRLGEYMRHRLRPKLGA